MCSLVFIPVGRGGRSIKLSFDLSSAAVKKCFAIFSAELNVINLPHFIPSRISCHQQIFLPYHGKVFALRVPACFVCSLVENALRKFIHIWL